MRSTTLLSLLAVATPTVLASAAESITGFSLYWSDTFSTGSLDTTKWTRFSGASSNGEEEQYTASGSTCEITSSNTLLITPQLSNGQWTSCRIESIPSFSAPAGGQMVVQARLRLGTPGSNLQGIWPAFWSLGNSMREGTPWPQCGEIDTFENINGGALGYGTVHCGSACNDPTGLSAGIDFSYGDFHTWAHAIDKRESDWTQQSITWYMDGQSYHVVTGADVGDQTAWQAMMDPMYLISNVAVGGGWPGSAAAQTASGQAAGMEIQYVGVYMG